MAELPPAAWLRAFETAARHNSFSAAAEELNLTPAAVSQHIRLLEKHLGTPLFTRLPKGVALTATGQAYAQPVRKSFAEMRRATEGLFGGGRKRTVAVRASVTYAVLVLAPRLRGFAAQHPDIQVQLTTAVWADRLDDEAIDIDIRWGNGDWDDGDIRHLGHEHAILVCHPDQAARIGPDLTAETLSRARAVQIIGSEFEWPRYCSSFVPGAEVPATWMRADSTLAALQIALSGSGAVITLESFVQDYLEQERLMSPFAHRLPVHQAHFSVLSAPAANRPEVQAFRDWLGSSESAAV
jgi:LysR family glycine cleavage system transcriptional activator